MALSKLRSLIPRRTREPVRRNKYMQEHWDLGTIEELIHHRRRQVLVHSILYYRLDTSIISDHLFDSWAKELAQVQRDNPEASERVIYHRDAFSNFNGETGHYLPLLDVQGTEVAFRILAHHKRESRRITYATYA